MEKEYLFLKECLEKGMSQREIAELLSKGRSTVGRWIREYGLSGYNRHNQKAYSFDKIDTKEKAYALGFLLADGSIDKNGRTEVSIAIRDKEILEFISTVIDANCNYSYTLNKAKKQFPRARMSKKISDITKFTGGRLKEERHYPRVREDLEKYLIQGLFDADGCITWGRRKDKNRVWQKIVFTSQLKILEGVQKFLYKNLNISTIVRPKGSEKCFVLEFSSKEDVLKFCEYIYSDKNFIILKRKYLKYEALRLELDENGETSSY